MHGKGLFGLDFFIVKIEWRLGTCFEDRLEGGSIFVIRH